MAPAGSFAAMKAAIKAGADSVYFGLDKLNMRARAARPFSRGDLPEIVRICNEGKVKSYLALNTILYEEDLELMRTLCLDAKEQGVSAVIASDPAAIQYAHNLGLEVHISTQANISNLEAVRFYSQWADVMVLARELTLKQIQDITTRVVRQDIRGPSGNAVRIELFVHGALCVAIAGKCFMSLAQTGHSANRGNCFQMCRRKYRVTDEDSGDAFVIDNQYVMSPKDICTIGILDQLIDSGVSILKIEGRGRSADYVYTVTRVYREALKAIVSGSYSQGRIKKWTERLEKVFNRGFWQGGYYLGKPMDMWSKAYGSLATEQKFLIGPVTNYFGRLGVAEVDVKNEGFSAGEKALLIGPTTGAVLFDLKSVYVNDSPAKLVKKGSVVTIRVPEKVRRNDKLYVIRERRDFQ